MRVTAIIVAAGTGRRVGGRVPKQFIRLEGRPVLAWALAAFQRHPGVQEIIAVVPTHRVPEVRGWGFKKVRQVVPGGVTRTDSVAAGLQAVSQGVSLVAVHDGARPLIDQATISRCLAAGRRWGAAIAALPVTDTVKCVRGGVIISTPPRDSLWCAQTPQVFRRLLLVRALARRSRQLRFTDDAQLVERLGYRVHTVWGSEDNVKITAPPDLERARTLLKRRRGGWRSRVRR